MVIKAPKLMPPDADQFPSNSTSTGQNSDPTTHPDPVVSPLFCDKISIVCPLTDNEMQMIKDRMHALTENGWACKRPSRRYKHALTVSLSGWMVDQSGPSTIRLDMGARRPDMGDFRIEFNPHKLRAADVATLVSSLAQPLGEKLLAHGRITRIDLAVDVSPIRFADVGIHVAKYSTSQAFWGSDGGLETAYWGKKAVVVYDKLRESCPAHEVPKADPPPTTLRFEARLKPNLALGNITQLPNPFERFRVCGWPGFSAPDPKRRWLALFMDSARQSGITATLSKLSQADRRWVLRRLESTRRDFWEPQAIWAGFPALVEDLLAFTQAAQPLPLQPLQEAV